MPIPPFVNGVLPPGTYQAQFTELVAAFDQPSSTTRPALNLALWHAAILIWSRDATAIIYVNGSYVTEKRDPLDVDVAVRSDVWDDTQFAAALAVAYPGESRAHRFLLQHNAQHAAHGGALPRYPGTACAKRDHSVDSLGR